MFRDTKKELARLEAELLAEESPESTLPSGGRNAYAGKSAAQPRRVYNPDPSDEDLDEYAEEVFNADKKGTPGFLVLLVFLLTFGLITMLVALLLREGML